jgi:hypothetical protein
MNVSGEAAAGAGRPGGAPRSRMKAWPPFLRTFAPLAAAGPAMASFMATIFRAVQIWLSRLSFLGVDAATIAAELDLSEVARRAGHAERATSLLPWGDLGLGLL